jgi:hypothetical protein
MSDHLAVIMVPVGQSQEKPNWRSAAHLWSGLPETVRNSVKKRDDHG